MTRIKAVIIEDELPAARLLDKQLRELRPEWEVTVLPGTIEDSVNWFSVHPQPVILVLDIQLTDGNSFIFIEQARPQSMIVFTTAYDEYAVRAFTVNSIDYLLKPVHKERLESAIQKFERFSCMGKGELNKLLGNEKLLHSFAEKQEKLYRTHFLISRDKHINTFKV